MSLKADFLKRKKNLSLFVKTPKTAQFIREMYDLKDTIFITDDFTAPDTAPVFTRTMNQHLPFHDFMIRGRSNLEDGDVDHNEILVRYKRLSPTKSRLYVFIEHQKETVPVVVAEYDDVLTPNEYVTIFPKKNDTPKSSKLQGSKISTADLAVLQALSGFRLLSYAAIQLLTYENTCTYTPPSNKLFFKKMSTTERASYVEYTLDLTKKLPKNKRVLGGTHASPREHVRRGHWRRTRSGERRWIGPVVVNEGSKVGKIEKEYKYGVETT